MADAPDVLTYEEAAASGVSRSAMRHALATGRWQNPHPGVLVKHSGSLTRRQVLEAALSYGGPDAALSHESAAECHRLRTARKTSVAITVPHGQRLTSRPGLVVHRTRQWTSAEVTVVGGLRCTTAERTTLDLAELAPKASRAIAIIADAVGSRRTTSRRLLDQAKRHNRLRWREAIMDALAETAEGAVSPLEIHHSKICRDHGLPVGVRQKRLILHGRVAYVDELLEPYGMVTELDGRLGHDETLERWRDMDRDNANVEQNRIPIRLGWEDLLDRPCEVAWRRARMMRKRGWTGRVKSCGVGCTATRPLDGDE
jgi:hypothetical protein